MGVTVIAPIPSKEIYETVNEQMFGSKQPQMMDGLIAHTAGEGPNGFMVVDVWESEEAFNKFFKERALPAMEASGISMGDGPPPQIIQLSTLLVGVEARV